MNRRRERGFLVLEILIAGLILTASIAATMYLFRLGYGYLEKTRQSNILSSKLIQAHGLIKTLSLDRKSGTEEMGGGVTLKWEAKLLNSSRPSSGEGEFLVQLPHQLFIYQVDFTAQFQDLARDYRINVFRFKSLQSNQSPEF
ncbi:MAG: hypothetical protein ACOYOS_14890 [Syntrophales bacterium]